VKRGIYIFRQAAYTIFSFASFLVFAAYLTMEGFWLITIKGKTEANKLEFHRRLQRMAKFVITRVPGTSFDYDNSVGEKFDKPAIIISNHQSHLDLMGIIMLTPKLVVLTNSWVWHNSFYGLIIRYADYLPVNDNPNLLEQIKDRLANGYSIMIFPEGTRSPESKILLFHRGAFKLADDLKLDILPIVIRGFGDVLPKTSWHLHPGKMKVEVKARLKRDDKEWDDNNYRGITRYMHRYYLAEYNG